MGAKGRPADARFSRTLSKIITVGVTEGSIMANIMTAHITSMKRKSTALQGAISGIAMAAVIVP